MAPIKQTATVNGDYDGSCARFDSLQAWLKVYGNAEYAVWKRNNAPSHLSYEEWAASEHVLGPYLWHATLDVWEEVSSSDEESEVEAPKLVSRGLPQREPNKKRTANGHGMPHTTNASASSARAKPGEETASAKKRRRPRKKYLSEEIVASDDSDDIDEPTPIVEVAAPAAPTSAATTNGRRKSGGRRKKQFLSEETIAPEDLEDDAMSIDEVAVLAAAAPVPSSPESPRETPLTTPKAKTPKTKSGRKPRKQYLSEEIVPLDDDDDSAPVADAGTATPNTAAASPEGPSTSSATRRGLRTRTPAQQRPYLHHAKLFEEAEWAEQNGGNDAKRSPKAKPTKLAQVSYPDEEDNLLDEEEDTIAVRQERPPQTSAKRHYKGKGRAWKKAEEDEDQDYKSPVKTKGSNAPKRKTKPRKSIQRSDSYVGDEVVSGAEEPLEEPAVESPAQHAPKPKGRRPRKSHHLSEEFVRDDSDSDMEEPQEEQQPIVAPIVQKTPKPKGRVTKTYPSIASKGSIDSDEEEEEYTPGYKKLTPKGKPRKTRGSIISLGETPEDKMGDIEFQENEQDMVTPLRKMRKRQSLGSDGGR